MEKFDFDAIILKPNDNVGTAIRPLKRYTEIILKLEEQLINFVIINLGFVTVGTMLIRT